MVLTTRHYIDRYSYDRGKEPGTQANATQSFLEDLFRLKNVLFLGYGLDELEVLEYVILKSSRKPSRTERVARHFILQPFFSHELDVARGVAAYFRNECDVTLIPFLRDRNNYAQLIEVLEHFARELSTGPMPQSERRYVMERLLE